MCQLTDEKAYMLLLRALKTQTDRQIDRQTVRRNIGDKNGKFAFNTYACVSIIQSFIQPLGTWLANRLIIFVPTPSVLVYCAYRNIYS